MEKRLIIIVVAIVITAFMQINAGVYIEGTTTQVDGSSKEKSIIYINSDRMRVENSRSHVEDAPDIVIFRQDKKVMWVIDTKEGTYWLTRAEFGTFKELSTEFGRTFLNR